MLPVQLNPLPQDFTYNYIECHYKSHSKCIPSTYYVFVPVRTWTNLRSPLLFFPSQLCQPIMWYLLCFGSFPFSAYKLSWGCIKIENFVWKLKTFLNQSSPFLSQHQFKFSIKVLLEENLNFIYSNTHIIIAILFFSLYPCTPPSNFSKKQYYVFTKFKFWNLYLTHQTLIYIYRRYIHNLLFFYLLHSNFFNYESY